MLLKIKGRNQERFRQTLESVMNIACVVARKGVIPNQFDIDNAETHGLYWHEDIANNVFDLCANTHKAFVQQRGENFIVIRFQFLYDTMGLPKAKSLSNLILAIFDNEKVELVVES
jgi:hypothetical protein